MVLSTNLTFGHWLQEMYRIRLLYKKKHNSVTWKELTVNWLKNKKWRFLLLFNRLCLDFLFFIDRYSMVHHLPMINLTKLTATRRHVYPKRTNFSKTLKNCFAGAGQNTSFAPAAPTNNAHVSTGTRRWPYGNGIQSLFVRWINIYP